MKEYIQNVHEGRIDLKEHTKRAIEAMRSIDEEYHYLTVLDKTVLDKEHKTQGKLAGVIMTVKDCICVEGMETQSSSRILNGYKPVFDATAVQRVKEEGAIIAAKTVQDEFGFGSFATNVGLGFNVPLNPFDKERATGGSSGGSGGMTRKADFVHASLAESTGGSIASPAAFCGVVGLCPTYGRVSRYGLLDYGNSLDKIGPMAQTVYGAALVLEVISGLDEKDSTCADVPVKPYSEYANGNVKGMRIGFLKDIMDKVEPEVRQTVQRRLEELKGQGAIVEEVSTPLVSEYSTMDYYLIALAEASTNLAKYCGMRYGAAEELEGDFNTYFSKVRSEHFGNEAKRRIILGTFARMAGYRDAYYIKAMKVRTKIIDEYKEVFKKYDVVVSCTMPILPPRFDEIRKLTPLQEYLMDVCTAGVNLAGLPHISVNAGFVDGLPVGIMFAADHFNEDKIIRAASGVELHGKISKD